MGLELALGFCKRAYSSIVGAVLLEIALVEAAKAP